MEEDSDIIEKMNALLREKAKEIYSEKIVDYGSNPRHYGTIDGPDGYARMPDECGKDLEMFLQAENGKIEDAKFTAGGCIFTVAACNAAAEMSIGRSLHECLRINVSSIMEHLGGLPKDHLHCAMRAALLFQRALKECILKNKKSTAIV
jgi:nitrogen fixation NifU-like protein